MAVLLTLFSFSPFRFFKNKKNKNLATLTQVVEIFAQLPYRRKENAATSQPTCLHRLERPFVMATLQPATMECQGSVDTLLENQPAMSSHPLQSIWYCPLSLSIRSSCPFAALTWAVVIRHKVEENVGN